MSEKRKNAVPDGCSTGNGGGKQNVQRDNGPTTDYDSTVGGTCRVRIADLLHGGSANGLTLSDLERLTGLEGREIRRRINRERRDGILIISDNVHGYFLAENVEEVRRFIRSMSRRAREIIAVCWAVEDGLAKMEGQETLFEGR